MVGEYPGGRFRKRFRVVVAGYLGFMLLWGFWVLAALDPAPSHLILGLAVVAFLVVASLLLPAPAPASASRAIAFARRSRTVAPPRLTDPDAAGRPRPRAPAVCPAA
jgi:uncharacterized protein (DUF58 family)